MEIVRENANGLTCDELKEAILKSIEGLHPKKVLIVPPDFTRANSGAGDITAIYYDILTASGAEVYIIPALGTHLPMTRSEQTAFFGERIPAGRFLVHRWRDHVAEVGVVPRSFVKEVSEGIMDEDMPVEVSKYLLDKSFDLVLSVGQVVPHEVVGMANYTKNIVVGLGGSRFINRSHMLGAFYGMERIMGRDYSPVRRVFDYAEQNFLKDIPIKYVLTVTDTVDEKVNILGLYIGRNRSLFERAVKCSQKYNLNYVDEPIKTCVVKLDPKEFHSTWLGNKAVYRTRMAMADGGRLIVLAAGVDKFGEDAENDRLIRKYGYKGRENILRLVETEDDLKANLSVAAHLIHGSSDGRFTITYAAKLLTRDEVEGVGFSYMPYDEAFSKYGGLKNGVNIVDGEEIYYIDNPALGLWAVKGAFDV